MLGVREENRCHWTKKMEKDRDQQDSREEEEGGKEGGREGGTHRVEAGGVERLECSQEAAFPFPDATEEKVQAFALSM